MSPAVDATGARRPLRVAVVLNQVLGWSQNFVTRELIQLAREGVELHIGAREVHLRDDLTPDEAALTDRLWDLPENPFTPRWLIRHVRFAMSRPDRYARAWRHLLTFPHDRVLRRARSFVCLGRAAAVARTLEALDVDLVYAHFLTAPAETAFYLSVLTGRPYGVTAHAMDIYTDNSGNEKKVRTAAFVATCSEYNRDHLRRTHDAPEARVHVVRYGIPEVPDFDRAAPDGRFTFFAAGRFVAKKGFEDLVDALARLLEEGRDVELRLAGVGPLEDELRERVGRLGIEDRVSFLGFVPPNRMTEAYRDAHAMVVPSVVAADDDRDGIPNVGLEAMAHSLPVVGTRVSGIPESIIEGETGFLAPPRDPEGLAGAMAAVLDHPDYAGLCRASRRLVRERFDLERNVSELLTLMREHAGSRPG